MLSVTTEESYGLTVDEVVGKLGTSAQTGLSQADVEHRRSYQGENVLKSAEEEPLWKKFLEQFKEPMILMLLASAGVSLLLGEYDDAISITLVCV